jgi:hypothetical protein
LSISRRRKTADRLAFLLDGVSEAERMARCRELRALSLVYLGLRHPVTVALGVAVVDPTATDRALAELGAIPALRRGRLLASYGALMGDKRVHVPEFLQSIRRAWALADVTWQEFPKWVDGPAGPVIVKSLQEERAITGAVPAAIPGRETRRLERRQQRKCASLLVRPALGNPARR